jgi:hypothetical protein
VHLPAERIVVHRDFTRPLGTAMEILVASAATMGTLLEMCGRAASTNKDAQAL